MRFYGADIEIIYTEPVTEHKIYIKSSGEWKEASDILVKRNGTWVSVDKVYKRLSGSWSQQDKSAMFNEDKFYRNQHCYFREMGGTIDEYVKDGIVFHLDAILSYANRNSDGTVKELIQSIDFVNNGCTCDGESIAFDGSASYLSTTAQTINFEASTHTIEVLIEEEKTGRQFILAPRDAGITSGSATGFIGLANWVTGESYGSVPQFTFSNNLRNVPEPNTAIEAHNVYYIGLNDDGCLLNGEWINPSEYSVKSGISNYYSSNTTTENSLQLTTVGIRLRSGSDAYRFKGKIFAIRIHNRKLTRAEMERNQCNDFARFNVQPYYVGSCVMRLDAIISYKHGTIISSGLEYIYADYLANNNIYFEDVVNEEKSLTFNGTSSWLRPSASAPWDAFNLGTHTIEMYFEPESYDTANSYRTVLYIPRTASTSSTDNICLYMLGSANNCQWCVKVGEEKVITFNSWPALNKKHYVAVNGDGFMLDGTYIPYAEWSSFTTSVSPNNVKNVSNGAYTCVSIGCRWNSSTGTQNFHGKIYAVRFHSKKLTEDEMRNNMMCDKIRFGE